MVLSYLCQTTKKKLLVLFREQIKMLCEVLPDLNFGFPSVFTWYHFLFLSLGFPFHPNGPACPPSPPPPFLRVVLMFLSLSISICSVLLSTEICSLCPPAPTVRSHLDWLGMVARTCSLGDASRRIRVQGQSGNCTRP